MEKIDKIYSYYLRGLLTYKEFERLSLWSAIEQLEEIKIKLKKLGWIRYKYNPCPTDFNEL